MHQIKAIIQNAILSRINTLAIVLLGILFFSNCGGTSVKNTTPTPAAVSPGSATLTTQAIQTFTANFSSASWSVNGVAGGNATVGTISSSGVYTAPAVPPSPNTVTITATSTTDSTKTASASVQINSPSPALVSISPNSIAPGSADTVVTVTGSGFTPQSTVQLGAAALTTTFVSTTQLTVTVPAAQLASPGTLSVSVVTPSPGGGASTSTSISVMLIAVAVSPSSPIVNIGQTQTFTPTVTGGTDLSVTWTVDGIAGGNATVGTIDAAGLYTAPAVPPSGTVTLTATSVADPSKSASATVTVLYPAPLLTSLSPAAVKTGAGNTIVTLIGSDFIPTSTVTINGSPLAATYSSPNQLTVTVPAAMLTSPAVLNLVVTNSLTPGGGVTAPLGMTVVTTGVVSPTANLLVAQYTISSPRDAMMSVEFGLDTNYGLKTWSQPVPTGGGSINMLVAGMKATTTYHMRATLDFTDGSQFTDSDKTFTTGTPDPLKVPKVAVTNPNGLVPSPGVLMGHLTNFLVPGTSPYTIAALDLQGNMVWYYDTGLLNGPPQPARLLANGHILAGIGAEVREIDLAGNIIFSFTTADVTQWLANAGYNITVNGLHHDILDLPNGHKILLINAYKTFSNLPGVTGSINVLGDYLVDVDPNYNVTWVWSGFDRLDINRHPAGLADWMHSNAVIYSPDDGDLILSIRSQSWVIKIDYQDGAGTGNILWRLGYQGDFTIDSGLNPDWQYAQHFPALSGPNSAGVFNLIVFDNGDNRVMDNLGTVCGNAGVLGPQLVGTIQCYTRSVEFRVDEINRNVSTAWQYNASPVYTFWGGSTQRLSTGNYVIDINTPTALDSAGSAIPLLNNPAGARYLELTPDQPPQIVMQLEVTGQNAYRMVHMPSLYPGVQW